MKTTTNLVEEGYVLLPGVLSKDEVAQLRSEVNTVLDAKGHIIDGGTVLPNAAAEAPSLSWIFCHEPILRFIRAQTGLAELIFTAEADLHRNFFLGTWHKDTGEASMPNGYFDCDSTQSDECRVYKIALYLQDHFDGKALTVRPGTTTEADLTIGQEYSIPVTAGDALLFDVRLTHRGVPPSKVDAATVRFGKLFQPPRQKILPVQLRRMKQRLLGRPDRLAIYFAFGAPNDKSEVFANRNMKRQLTQLGTERFLLPNELEKRFAESGVRVAKIDPPN